MMLAYYDVVQTIVGFRQSVPDSQFATVRYEDLSRDPIDIMRQVCSWLGLKMPTKDIRKLVYSEPAPVFMPEDERWEFSKAKISEVLVNNFILSDESMRTQIPQVGFPSD